MNVASQALCRELFELSGWDDTAYRDDYIKPNHGTSRYDLGYLLRKLQTPVLFRSENADNWTCGDGSHPTVDAVTADTPEDCAAKLAIELFKQGILRHE